MNNKQTTTLIAKICRKATNDFRCFKKKKVLKKLNEIPLRDGYTLRMRTHIANKIFNLNK